jgi:LacI family kdg operon repressor
MQSRMSERGKPDMPSLGGRKKSVTIDQVAAQAGVSKTTVSRFLNGRYDALSNETRERVEEVIEQLHYRPNRMAQSLKARNSRLIGCLVSDISSPFSALIVKGINSVCLTAGYQLLLVDSGDDPERERMGIRDLLENQVDGLIVNTTGQNDEYLISLHERGVPLVLADRCLSAPGLLDTVATESYHITYQCVTYLKSLGYDQVAFFTQGNGHVAPRLLRYQGYYDALRDHFGHDGGERLYQFRLEDKNDCVRCLDTFRSKYSGQRLAAFAVNGVTMLNLLQGIQAAGIQIGAAFGVCGFDDWGWADLIPPGITTITQDSWMVGRRSAELLLERIAGKGPEYQVYEELPNRLEIRGSTVKG